MKVVLLLSSTAACPAEARWRVRVAEPQPPSSSSRPVLQSSSRFSLSSVVSLLNMSNDVVISVSLHLSMSDGKQECGAHPCECV